MARRIDLHTHSAASDGLDSPEELIARASAAGLAAVALTDHDTLAGLAAASVAAAGCGLEFVRGCELAVGSPYGEVHLLGLWLAEHPQPLEDALTRLRKSREERVEEMLGLFRKAGYALEREDLLAGGRSESIGRPHVARLLVRKGICSSVQEAFTRFLGDGMPMYVPRDLPSPAEGLDLLKKTGGTTVFAHPMLLRLAPEKLERLVQDLVEAGLDAIEVFHSEHSARAVQRAQGLASRYGLAVSGGSDYHGASRPDVRLGSGKGNLFLPYSILENLRMLRAEQGLPF